MKKFILSFFILFSFVSLHPAKAQLVITSEERAKYIEYVSLYIGSVKVTEDPSGIYLKISAGFDSKHYYNFYGRLGTYNSLFLGHTLSEAISTVDDLIKLPKIKGRIVHSIGENGKEATILKTYKDNTWMLEFNSDRIYGSSFMQMSDLKSIKKSLKAEQKAQK